MRRPLCRSIRSDRLFLCFYRMQQASSSSKNAYPSLRACKMQSISRSLSRICNVFLTKMDVLLPATFSMNSLPDLLLLVNAEHKMLYCLIRILRTARLICCSSMRNRDNAILPVTHYRNSPPDLLLVNAEQKMPCCRTRITGTARLICCCSSTRNTRCSTASYEFSEQLA